MEDLDEEVSRLERLGFGPFVAYPPLTDYVQLEVPDAPAFYDLRIKVCDVGPVALQIIEAKGTNTIYGAFLGRGGEGVFHLGFLVESLDLAEKELLKGGVHVLSRGRRADGSGFVYLDTEPDLGVALLVRQNPGRGLRRSVRSHRPARVDRADSNTARTNVQRDRGLTSARSTRRSPK